ncbi:MAG TPA: Ppx/GppA phosphatase family protein [Tepidisphaeraceae bacterium]|nr:Ppx/GppA phosphatase family protein [Tepidisphaeraceae bacterium]
MTSGAFRAARTSGRPSDSDSLRLAAIDVGSNSIHMIVAQADSDGGMTTLWRMKEPVGLGRISFPSRRLSGEAMQRAVTVLERFKQAAAQRRCEKTMAIATSAVREAQNGGDLIERIRRELGLWVRVVSARDEARLIYLAARHALDLGRRPHLIMDIGGGSVEFIVGDEQRAQILESRKLGAARLTARFVKSDPMSKDDRKAMARHFEKELGPLFEDIRRLKPASVIGTSGTLENIAQLCDGMFAEADEHGLIGTIERGRFDKLLDKLVDATQAERASMRGLDDQRKDQILAGALMVKEVFERLGVKRIGICPAALREGVVLDYLGRHLPDLAIRREVPDPRRRSVLDLARRCDWHKTHSEHVTSLCLNLFDELKSTHGLGNIERELIEYAAMLHDIGWHIAGSGHHKHSMYLISNGKLKNFSTEEVEIIANIARYHRKTAPTRDHKQYKVLSSRARRVVDVGAALLRIADGLDRSHASAVQSVNCRVVEKQVRCTITTRADAELEIWGARRKADWFEKVFGMTIEFREK